MRALALVAAGRAWIPVLLTWIAVIAGMVLVLFRPRLVEAQAGRDLTVDIAKAGALPEIPSGTNVAFVVTVANVRAGQVSSSVLTRVTMPAGFTSLSTVPAPGTGFSCNTTGSIVQCTLPSFGGNTQKTFRITSTAPATISGASQAFTLTAQVDPDNTVGEGPTGNGNNSDNFTLNVVTQSDLNVNLVGAPGQDFTKQVAPNLVYFVTVKNDGDRDAAGVLVRSTLPKDVSFVKVEENTLGTCLQNSTASNGALNVNCTLSSLPARADRHVRIIAKTVGSVPDGAQVTFAANVDPNNSVSERNETNNTAFMVTTMHSPSDVQITRADVALHVAGSPPLVGGHPGDFACKSRVGVVVTLTVKNNGPLASPATTVGATWPAQIVAASGSCFTGCAVPALQPGQTALVSLAGLINANMVGLQQATFVVDPNQRLFDPIVGNNRSVVTACG